MSFQKVISSITTLALCVSLVTPMTTFAAATFTGGTNVSGGLNVQVPITDLQITGVGAEETVPVFLYVPAGSLSMTTTTGITFTGSNSGQRLYFSGTRTNVNNALATLRYTHSSAGTYTLEASIIGAGQIYDPSTQHIYEVVNNGSPITATAARSAATSRSINGVSGYLANITSSEENAFVAARITQDGWFGASDAGIEGDWVWLDGPESGTLFWRGTFTGTSFWYENWANNEPNQSGDEDCSQFYANGSGWNDLPCSTTLNYYVVEYGAPGNLPNVASETLDITLSADTTTQTPTLTSPASNSRQNTLQLTYTLPEAPLANSVRVIFHNWTHSNTYIMGDTQSVNVPMFLHRQASFFEDPISYAGVVEDVMLLWLAQWPGTLPDGTYTVTLSYQDYLGNPASTAVASSVTIDTIALAPGIQRPSNHEKILSATSLAEWTCETGATVSISHANLSTNPTTVVCSGGTFSTNITFSSGLNSEFTLSFTQTDLAGNVSSATTKLVRYASASGGGGGKTTYFGCRDDKAINYDSESTHKAELCEYKKVEPTPKTETESANTTKENISQEKPIQESHTVLNSAPTECNIAQYTTETIRLGRKNNPEQVKLLEQFLNRYENAHLEVNGIYEKADFEAVIRWQEKHTDDILKPWGLKKGTGYVYTRSLAKIKALEEASCPTKKEDSKQTDDILNKENDTK